MALDPNSVTPTGSTATVDPNDPLTAPVPPDWTVPAGLKTMPAINTGNLLAGIKTEVDAGIKTQVDPLQQMIDQYMTQSGRAVTDLNNLYDNSIMPASQQATDQLRAAYDQSMQAEQGIQAAATARLNQLHQQRASDAQQLAQQIGGPVPLEMFVNPVDIENTLLQKSGQGNLLYTGMMRDAGLAQAEAFSGQVFPLLRAQQTQETRNFFRDKVAEVKQQIATIKGTRKGLINEELRKRTLEEREFQLKKLEADRQLWLDKQTGKQEAYRIAAGVYATDVAANTDLTKTAAGVQQANADRKATTDLNNKKIAAGKASVTAAQAKATAERKQNTRSTISSLVTAAFSSGQPHDVYQTLRDPVTGELKSMKVTVASAGGVNPETGHPWQSKDEVVSWILGRAGVDRSNAEWRAYAQTAADNAWRSFAVDRQEKAKATKAAKSEQAAFNHDKALAKQMGWDGVFPPTAKTAQQKKAYVTDFLAAAQAKHTHMPNDPATIRLQYESMQIPHLLQVAKKAGLDTTEIEKKYADNPHSNFLNSAIRSWIVNWLMQHNG